VVLKTTRLCKRQKLESYTTWTSCNHLKHFAAEFTHRTI